MWIIWQHCQKWPSTAKISDRVSSAFLLNNKMTQTTWLTSDSLPWPNAQCAAALSELFLPGTKKMWFDWSGVTVYTSPSSSLYVYHITKARWAQPVGLRPVSVICCDTSPFVSFNSIGDGSHGHLISSFGSCSFRITLVRDTFPTWI